MKYREIQRILKEHGWNLLRIKGSHYIYNNKKEPGYIIIPRHGKELKKGNVQTTLSKYGIIII